MPDRLLLQVSGHYICVVTFTKTSVLQSQPDANVKMTEFQYKALLALSGKPDLAAARSIVIQQLSTEQLSRVNEDALLSCVGQESREALTCTILDFMAKQQDTAVVGANTQSRSSQWAAELERVC